MINFKFNPLICSKGDSSSSGGSSYGLSANEQNQADALAGSGVSMGSPTGGSSYGNSPGTSNRDALNEINATDKANTAPQGLSDAEGKQAMSLMETPVDIGSEQGGMTDKGITQGQYAGLSKDVNAQLENRKQFRSYLENPVADFAINTVAGPLATTAKKGIMALAPPATKETLMDRAITANQQGFKDTSDVSNPSGNTNSNNGDQFGGGGGDGSGGDGQTQQAPTQPQQVQSQAQVANPEQALQDLKASGTSAIFNFPEGSPERTQAIEAFAAENNMPVETVNQMIQGMEGGGLLAPQIKSNVRGILANKYRLRG